MRFAAFAALAAVAAVSPTEAVAPLMPAGGPPDPVGTAEKCAECVAAEEDLVEALSAQEQASEEAKERAAALAAAAVVHDTASSILGTVAAETANLKGPVALYVAALRSSLTVDDAGALLSNVNPLDAAARAWLAQQDREEYQTVVVQNKGLVCPPPALRARFAPPTHT